MALQMWTVAERESKVLFSLECFKILLLFMVSPVIPHFKNWHILVDIFGCVPGFSNSLQSLARTFHNVPMAQDSVSLP